MNIKNLSAEEKKLLSQELNSYVESVGGNRNFYELLETLRVRKPNPILNKSCVVEYPEGLIKWNKVLHQDKYVLLKEAMEERRSDNILPGKDHKKYKKILNMLKALKPITFSIQPIKEHGDGFTFNIIDSVKEEKTTLNPIFEIMFFSSIDLVKKILAFTQNKES